VIDTFKVISTFRHKQILLFSCLTLVIGLASCGGSFSHRLALKPNEPLRLAVVPFRYLNSDGMETAPPTENLLIDNVNPLASEPTGTAPQVARSLVQGELSKTSFHILNPFVVENELTHHGFTNEHGKFLIDKVFAVPAAELCGELLGCDAVLYGTVNRWDRSYYGLESVASIDLEIRIVSAKDGHELFYSKGADAARRGISGGPTGFSDLVLEPLKGLDAEVIEGLARQIVQQMFQPLFMKQKDAALKAAPPAIYAAAHNSEDGILSPAGDLSILVYGTPRVKASFSLGRVVQEIPLNERSPGHYVGKFFPVSSLSLDQVPLMVTLEDENGFKTTQKVVGPTISLPSS